VVNPHHYEELLHYAMRMGKMRMEEKVFYLIHGITSGLMPLERLRVLSGERGELLMKFPFLDYFYQHHNSIPELRKIADRITEYEDGKPTLKPGAKTTMFIRLVLLRDDEARNRMSKASDRVAEQLDHEDIPYLATELDWVKMLALGGAMSGDRPKVTKEGWKNAYVGFNEKFKIYAHLAKLAAGGEAIFRESDIREIAKTIAAYITMDNVLMRITPMRPSLSREALEDEAPVSNPNLRTSAFRNRTREFVWELAEAVGMQDSDLHDPNITIREFLASEGRDRDGVLPEKQTRIAQAREHFFRAFTEKIVRHPDKLMEKLTQFEEGEFRFGKMFLDSHIRDEQGTDMITYEEFSKGYNAIIGAENAGG
jgi:hypothetical protein